MSQIIISSKGALSRNINVPALKGLSNESTGLQTNPDTCRRGLIEWKNTVCVVVIEEGHTQKMEPCGTPNVMVFSGQFVPKLRSKTKA